VKQIRATTSVAINEAIIKSLESAINAATDLDTRNAVAPVSSIHRHAAALFAVIGALHAAINAGKWER
jgi:hypothetical protein